MQQFYFLSVVANALAGMTLCAEFLKQRFPGFADFEQRVSSRGARAGIGAAAAIVGFFKLFIRSTPTDVRVVGDLLPALLGIAMGAALLLELRSRPAEEGESPQGLTRVVTAVAKYRVPLGLAGILIGLLHFFIPGAVIF